MFVIERVSGEKVEVPVTCRLDSDAEVKTYQVGGVLQQFAGSFWGILDWYVL
ncbi:hypothetical protein L4F92_00755 [Avibacterium sp. 21-595]|uniref:hypothetical protein n=1 Tax=Avibacterium sp. 21-595 TaxID=2911527 RepID=UPI002025C11F|nr:hypothetical protein [Avibacterium sp. 21-595]URL06690.1 hypothetical protein L4F92_00755 [Avibacterium sp. 21-595]